VERFSRRPLWRSCPARRPQRHGHTAAQEPPARPSATPNTASPHILAGDFTGLGLGYGYAVAKDNICGLANSYLTVDAQRSRYLGPGGSGDDTITPATSDLNSDLYFQSVDDSGAAPSPGPRPCSPTPSTPANSAATA
jgi:Penicillin amidase